jgi:hypothetical protein
VPILKIKEQTTAEQQLTNNTKEGGRFYSYIE